MTPVFIGDEVTAAAYRLAGLRTLVPDNGAVATAFESALATAELVIITAACALEVADERLDAAVRNADPLVLVVPDAANRLTPPDLDRQVDRVLGIEA